MTEPSRLAVPRVLRIAGVADFVIACLCLATPMLRSAIGDTMAYAFAALLLAGSAVMFLLARRMERQVATMPASSSPATR
jgi:hypothetical protein